MKTYVTFGQGHVRCVNGKIFDLNCVAVIEAPTEREGREKAMELFDAKFHKTYFEGKVDLPDMLKWFPRGLVNVEDNADALHGRR